MIASKSASLRRNLQVKFTRQVAGSNDFVAYVDAIGKLDGKALSAGVENVFGSISGRA